MNLEELIDSRRFLGSEFLMWLWFKSECLDGYFDIQHHGDVEVLFDDRLRMEAYAAETERNTFKGGSPASSPEAKTALRERKRPTRARLRIIKEGREWKFKFKAEGFELSTLKIPSVLSDRDDEQFQERMSLIEEVEDILDRLYREFIIIRTSDNWFGTMVPAISRWIDSDSTADPDDYPDGILEDSYQDPAEEVS
jgi:hypothetical protein